MVHSKQEVSKIVDKKMTVVEITKEIESCQLNSENLMQKFKSDETVLLDALTNAIQASIQKEIEVFVRENPVNTKALGLEKLKGLKAKMQKLIDATGENVSDGAKKFRLFSYPDYRPTQGEAYERKPRIEHDIDQANKRVSMNAFEPVGLLLYEFGYITQKTQNYQWKFDYANERPELKYGISLGDTVEKALSTYKKHYFELDECQYRIKELTTAREEREAVDLWSQV